MPPSIYSSHWVRMGFLKNYVRTSTTLLVIRPSIQYLMRKFESVYRDMFVMKNEDNFYRACYSPIPLMKRWKSYWSI
ncbi:hypothetical protein DPMN_122612 [Dreissena polymorpha]|uniref:Uncharacterized protein n=1 Tax=Dreissena polymorpha TaxID=45954 RepID=A0A9D4JUC7_DREPO|nr:hypothetical protein DPMN_122612 [Dreissena polymorpha]